MKTYICDACHGTFHDHDDSDEVAQAAKDKDFPEVPDEKCASVCNDCYMKIIGNQKN